MPDDEAQEEHRRHGDRRVDQLLLERLDLLGDAYWEEVDLDHVSPSLRRARPVTTAAWGATSCKEARVERALIDLDVAEGIDQLDVGAAAPPDGRGEARRAGGAAGEVHLPDAQARRLGEVEVEAALNLRGQGLGDVGEDGLDLFRHDGVGVAVVAADLEQLGLFIGDVEVSLDLFSELPPALVQVAGEARDAVVEHVDVDRRGADVQQPDGPWGRVVVEREHVLNGEAVDVDDGRGEPGLLDDRLVLVHQLFAGGDQAAPTSARPRRLGR
jgi:hypothetical protein